MTAKEHLQTVYKIQKRIDRLNSMRENIRAELYSLGSPAGGMDKDKVQTSLTGDKMLQLVARVDEVERDIVKELERLTLQKKKILDEIELVPKETHKQVLYDRYILCKKWEQIAVDYDKSVRWIYMVHGKALISFEKVAGLH